ncbi:MAG: NAD(P)-dependent oxidoreductase [Burkholderiaceae bacterium]
MPGPVILFDPWPRSAGLIFSAATLQSFAALGQVVGLAESVGRKLPAELLEQYLADAVAIVGQTDLDARRLARAPKLRTVINVEGNFAQNVDYGECFRRGIQVLGVAPVFAQPVAEMALGMAIDLARGITCGDHLMRQGQEQYGLAGNRQAFLLRGETMGLIGCGNLGRALIALLAPFRPRLLVHDPWLPDTVVQEFGAEPASLERTLSEPRVIFALAGVTAENQGWLNRDRLQSIRSDAIFLLMSRAGIVDFDALVDLVAQGRFRAATDVFPVEPVPPDAPVRQAAGMLLSAHRAGGLPTALADIGQMVVDDLTLILAGLPPQRLQAARPETVERWRNPPGRSYAPGTRL